MFGCKGLKTSCNQFNLYKKSIAWIYNCGECKYLVNISLWSSTLPPWKNPCVHKNWSSVPLSAFWLQRSTKNDSHTKKYFLRHLCNGRYTQLICLSEACQALRYDCQFAFHYLQTAHFYQLWKLLCLLFQRKHFPWTFKRLKQYATGFLPLFQNITFSSHFFATFESIRKF